MELTDGRTPDRYTDPCSVYMWAASISASEHLISKFHGMLSLKQRRRQRGVGGGAAITFHQASVTPATLKFCCLVNRGTMGVNSLPETVTRQRRDCDLNPVLSAPESSTLTTRLPSHPCAMCLPKTLLGPLLARLWRRRWSKMHAALVLTLCE